MDSLLSRAAGASRTARAASVVALLTIIAVAAAAAESGTRHASGSFAAGPPATAGPAADAASPGRYIAVVGGVLIDGTGAAPVPDSAVILEGDRVRAAGPRRQVRIPPGAVAVDATGKTVLPGLVDMHVHLLPGIDVAEFLRWGVTSVRHLGDTELGAITGLKRRVESGEQAGPRIFHCGLFVVSEPPLKPERYPPADLEKFLIMRSPEDAPKIVQRLVDAGADVVKIKTEMNPEWLRPLVEAATRARLPVSFDNAGDHGFYDALQAVEAGAVGVEHLNGIPLADAGVADKVMKKMLLAGAFAVPTFVVLDSSYSEEEIMRREDFMRRFSAAGGMVLAGTDAPTRGLPFGRSLHREMQRLAIAGLGRMGAIVAATGAAGRALGYQGLVGTIEAGSYADLVIVDGDPLSDLAATEKITQVFKGGVEVPLSRAPAREAAAGQ